MTNNAQNKQMVSTRKCDLDVNVHTGSKSNLESRVSKSDSRNVSFKLSALVAATGTSTAADSFLQDFGVRNGELQLLLLAETGKDPIEDRKFLINFELCFLRKLLYLPLFEGVSLLLSTDDKSVNGYFLLDVLVVLNVSLNSLRIDSFI